MAAWFLGAAACGWWSWGGASGWRAAMACGAVLAASLCAGWWWWQLPAGLLGWDGGAWTWSGDKGGEADAGAVEVVLDLQQLLLLRWQGMGRRHWLWLERSRVPARWDALRRAVYSRANPDALPGAEPPSART